MNVSPHISPQCADPQPLSLYGIYAVLSEMAPTDLPSLNPSTPEAQPPFKMIVPQLIALCFSFTIGVAQLHS